jgi:hypothetical protein
VDLSKSLLHSVQADFLKATTKESPVVEGISRAWRLHEEALGNSNGFDRIPFEETSGNLHRAKIEPETTHTLPDIGQIGMRRSRRLEEDIFEWSPKLKRIIKNCERMGIKGEENSRGSHNFGRKTRVSSRETIRTMRQLPREERMIAGEILRSDGEERRNRRRARACKRPLAEVLEFPTRTSQSADESAAA